MGCFSRWRRGCRSNLYFETKSSVTALSMMQKKYPEDDRLTKLLVHWLVNRFQQTGSVEDSEHNNSGYFQKRLDVVKAQNVFVLF